MTEEQRADVVELLRCAADVIFRGWPVPSAFSEVYDHLGLNSMSCEPWQSAWAACVDVAGSVAAHDEVAFDHATRPWVLLEAAARVEEGSWP